MQFTAPNLPLEDVIREVIRSEPEPDYITLMKWSARYPRYREDLEGASLEPKCFRSIKISSQRLSVYEGQHFY